MSHPIAKYPHRLQPVMSSDQPILLPSSSSALVGLIRHCRRPKANEENQVPDSITPDKS